MCVCVRACVCACVRAYVCVCVCVCVCVSVLLLIPPQGPDEPNCPHLLHYGTDGKGMYVHVYTHATLMVQVSQVHMRAHHSCLPLGGALWF